jgi:tetratricopeptide (TPR) repeat protein
MNVRKVSFSPFLWMLILTLIFFGLQSQTQKPLTRAEDGPGFGILVQAKQLNGEKQFAAGFAKAIEASRVFRQNAEWQYWGEAYEEAFQSARKSESKALYKALLVELSSASQLLPGIKDMPSKTQATIWRRMGSIQHFLGAYDEAGKYYEKALPFAEQAADTALMIRIYGNAAIIIAL